MSKEIKKNNQWVAASGLGMELSIGMGLCVYVSGYFFKRMNWSSEGGVLSGVTLGLIYGGYQLWKFIQSDQHKNQKEDT